MSQKGKVKSIIVYRKSDSYLADHQVIFRGEQCDAF